MLLDWFRLSGSGKFSVDFLNNIPNNLKAWGNVFSSRKAQVEVQSGVIGAKSPSRVASLFDFGKSSLVIKVQVM